MTELRDRCFDTMYRPGRIAQLIADCSAGLGMIAVGAGLIVYALIVR